MVLVQIEYGNLARTTRRVLEHMDEHFVGTRSCRNCTDIHHEGLTTGHFGPYITRNAVQMIGCFTNNFEIGKFLVFLVTDFKAGKYAS